jgi:hypothetical protein
MTPTSGMSSPPAIGFGKGSGRPRFVGADAAADAADASCPATVVAAAAPARPMSNVRLDSVPGLGRKQSCMRPSPSHCQLHHRLS